MGRIRRMLSETEIECRPNMLYHIRDPDEDRKRELKRLLPAQGSAAEPHSVVEINFSKEEPKKLTRREKLKRRNSAILGGAGSTTICPDNTAAHPGNATEPDIRVYNSSIFVAGKYIKLSRQMTQTPLIIGRTVKTQRSVSDFCEYFREFYRADEARFLASGREDVDVRCTGGRPFVVEIVRPTRQLKAASIDVSLYGDVDIIEPYTVKREYQAVITSDESYKVYYLVVYRRERIEFSEQYEIDQKTPLRVLHRRTNMVRKRRIEILDVEEYTERGEWYYGVRIRASAGAYIKEWVSGDFGRTVPNLDADLLLLDVETVEKQLPEELIISRIELRKYVIDCGPDGPVVGR